MQVQRKVVVLHHVAHVLERLTRRHVKTRGTCAVPLTELESRLTKKALVVWACYAAYRDKYLECWPAAWRIADMASEYLDEEVTAQDVRRALKRLRVVGLVKDIRWVVLERYRKVYYRQIFGRVFQRDLAWWVSVPMAVARKLTKLSTRGGRRPGAGGPIGGGTLQMVKESKSSSDPKTDTSSISVQKAHNSMGSIPSSSSTDLRASLSEKLGQEATEPSFEEKQEQPTQVTNPGDPVEAFEGMEIPPPYDGPIYAPGAHGIPERPCVAVLNEMGPDGYRVQTRQPLMVPPARTLREADLKDESALLRRMRTALEGAVRGRNKRGGGRWVRKMSARDKVKAVELARALADVPASPEAWFMFSAARWGSVNRRKMPVGYALSMKRFEAQRGWFRASEGYACRRVFRTRTEDEMCRLHSRMIYSLWELEPKTDAEIKAVVGRFFPGNTWDTMVEQVRREIDEDQARIDARVKRGEFVW